MKKYLILLFLLIFFNLILFLALEINNYFAYFLLSFLIVYNHYILKALKKDSKSNKDEKLNEAFDVPADEHPVIKAAKERLGK